MIAKMFFAFLFASLSAIAADPPTPQAPESKPGRTEAPRKSSPYAGRRDAQKHRASAPSGKGLVRRARHK